MLVSFLLSVAPAQLGAQAQPTAADTVEAVKRALKSDLRNFVTAQEAFFADHNTYARSLRAMAQLFRPTAGVTLVLLTSSDTGHSEIATDERVPGLVCAMYVGDAPPPMGRGNEGEVVCRDP
jgi:hypothetical protein